MARSRKTNKQDISGTDVLESETEQAQTQDLNDLEGANSLEQEIGLTEESAEELAAEDRPRPNIIFVGRKVLKGKITSRKAPTSLTDASFSVTLPDEETQKKGFFHPDAGRIIQAFPQLYKEFVIKGE